MNEVIKELIIEQVKNSNEMKDAFWLEFDSMPKEKLAMMLVNIFNKELEGYVPYFE